MNYGVKHPIDRAIIAQHRRSGTGGGSGQNKAWRENKARMDVHDAGTKAHNFFALGWGKMGDIKKTAWQKHIDARARANEEPGEMLRGLSLRSRYGVKVK